MEVSQAVKFRSIITLPIPCDTPMQRKLFRPTVSARWNIIGKETIDEIIFRTTNVRNRLILELMAHGGMRIGEVLKLRLIDIQDRKLIIKNPKSGKEQEVVFISALKIWFSEPSQK